MQMRKLSLILEDFRLYCSRLIGGKMEEGKVAEGSALAEFKQGINLLRNGRSAEALNAWRHAVWSFEQQNLYYLPFWECSAARAQRKWDPRPYNQLLREGRASLRRTEVQLS